MASFTDTQKTQIIAKLGYAQLNSLGNYSNQLGILRDFLNRSDFTPDYITEVQSVLTDLYAIDAQLTDIALSSNIIKADVVEFSVSSGNVFANKRGSQLVNYLGLLIGVHPAFNIYNSCSKISFNVGY